MQQTIGLVLSGREAEGVSGSGGRHKSRRSYDSERRHRNLRSYYSGRHHKSRRKTHHKLLRKIRRKSLRKSRHKPPHKIQRKDEQDPLAPDHSGIGLRNTGLAAPKASFPLPGTAKHPTVEAHFENWSCDKPPLTFYIDMIPTYGRHSAFVTESKAYFLGVCTKIRTRKTPAPVNL
ncbi:hypothetical protein [Paenibacillus rigui]|uniref:hypothetical protein n=1 Tax=Paenibacillus rigui TaxID=554312 RepID=UPI003CCC43A6